MKYIIFLTYMMVCYSRAADKYWNNYQTTNLRNWNNEISVNGLFFSANIENPMAFYSHDEDICQIVIPMNSDDNDTNFSWTPVTPEKQIACPDQESGNTFWIDPRNWHSSKTSNATPHLERLPCAYDSVSFKQINDLYVILPTTPIKIRRFFWNSQTLHQYNFNVTMRTEQFLKNFIVTGSQNVWDIILVTSNSCTIREGCECGTYKFYKGTCKLLRNECNSSLPCSTPVKPNGHCCNICGCYLEILFDPATFIYNKLEAVVKKFFEDKKKLDYYVSKLPGTYVQIVIINAEDTYNHDEVFYAVSKLQNLLQSDDPSLSHLSSSIMNAAIFCSMPSYNSFATLNSVSHVVIPLVSIASLVILIVLVFQSKISVSKLQNIFKTSFSFVKFENQFEKNEVDEKQLSQSQQEQENDENKNELKKIDSELHSEGRSENGTSSEPDNDSVLVELS